MASRSAAGDDIPELVRTLVESHLDDVWERWLLPDDDTRPRRLDTLYRLDLEVIGLPHGDVWSADDHAAVAVCRLQCAAEVESGTYTLAEGAEGFETVEEAARDWMADGDGAFPPSALSELDPIAEPTGRVELVDDTGEVRIVLIARDYGNGWLIESTERCCDG